MNRIEIDAKTLQDWLDTGEPVEVIDIRPHSDYHAWHIPNSRNVDAYAAIYRNSPGPLKDYTAPNGKPVVAVCYLGQTSQVAAHYLRARGLQAVSLAGGMQAWSLAWNTAEVPVKNGARVIQVRRTGKGCLSYLVASEEEALVIDPSIDPQIYLDLAAEGGWRITKVIDTHIHADHLSRARLLAALTSAQYYLPAQDRTDFAYQAVDHGDVIELGAARLEVIHTPGHTFEAVSFMLDGEALFTGDTLFLDSVGRPDLKAGRAETAARARALFRSLQKLVVLEEDFLILPCHVSKPVPFDRSPLTAPLNKVVDKVEALGYDEEKFVNWILARIPSTPPNYDQIVRLNEGGSFTGIDPTQLEAGGNFCAV